MVWRTGTLLRPFCHLVIRAIRVVPHPLLFDRPGLAAALRTARLQANLTRVAAAAQLGVAARTVGSWERAESTPERHSWQGLMTLLGGAYARVPHPHAF